MEKGSHENRINRVMIAAPASGSGKTVFTCGLLSLLKEEGRDPASFKCGPDFIDPMFHRDVLGIEGDNLDPFFSDSEKLKDMIASCGHDTAILEGAMGIYDGIAGRLYESSCYDVARVTGTPIVLLINAKGMGSTMLSIIKGILQDDEAMLIKGMILNRISSHFYELMRPLIEEMLDKTGSERGSECRLLGGIPDSGDITLGTRHLGLVMPDEYDDLGEKIAAFRDLIKRYVDMDALYRIMESADTLAYRYEDLPLSGGETLKIAVARDEAFSFYYKENINEMKRHGIEPVYCSPVHDSKLPDGVSALMLRGGYPELYAEQLSGNTSMRDSIRAAVASGMPSLAECGGFMYLLESLETDDGKSFDMAGVVKGSCHNTGRLGRFGYITVSGKEERETLLSGLSIKAHEFHYFDSDNNGSDAVAVKPGSGRRWECIHAGGDHLWGYPHLYYPSCPELVGRLRMAMERYVNK